MKQFHKYSSKISNKWRKIRTLVKNKSELMTCKSNDVVSSFGFSRPGDYEFSCSSTPAARHRTTTTTTTKRGEEEFGAMQKAIEVLSRYNVVEANSPLLEYSPLNQVDRDAEDFINKFYEELNNQRRK